MYPIRLPKIVAVMSAFILALTASAQQSTTWTGSGGDRAWSNPLNWSLGVPQAGDTAVLGAGANVLLSEPSESLASFQMTGGSLTFSNWSTKLTAVDVTVSGGQITLPPPFMNNDMSNRVWVACQTFTLTAPGTIDVLGKGYAGGVPNGDGHGEGASIGDNHPSAPGYGGFGGDGGRYAFRAAGKAYGQAGGPALPGSGSAGGAASQSGAAGGGAVQIDATGHVLVNGTISADGAASNGSYVPGGSGGGIYIGCRTFGGTNGLLSANGKTGGANSAGSGGGRIAVVYDTTEQAALPVPQVVFSAARGTTPGPGSDMMVKYKMEEYLPARLHGGAGDINGQLGTLYFPDNRFLVSPILHSGVWMTPQPLAAWDLGSLVVSNAHFSLPKSGLALTVSGPMTLLNGARFELTNATVSVGGDLVISNSVLDLKAGSAVSGTDWVTLLNVGGNLTVHGKVAANASSILINAGETNSLGPDYGARVTVAGESRIGPYGWIVPRCHPFNGGAPLFQLQDLTVLAPSSGFNADRGGYRGGYNAGNGQGPGFGSGHLTRATGAGYGGRGGRSDTIAARGIVYGQADRPLQAGSGGGGARTTDVGLGGRGGGLIRIEANRVLMDGFLTANGSGVNIGGVSYSGGGSGGGILLTCRTFSGGATAQLRADGGAAYQTSYCGGGGGGRIAVAYGSPYTETIRNSRLIISETAPSTYAGGITILAGAGYTSVDSSQPGTIRFIQVLLPNGTLMMIR